MKRDPERVDRILEKLAYLWRSVPDMRLGQIVVCSVPSSMEARLFSVEDDVIEAGLDKLIAVADGEEVQSGERS